MSEPEQSNHWASLADKLGIDADTSAAKSRPHDPLPEQLSHQPKRHSSPNVPRPSANWDEVASQLGIAPSKETEVRDEEPQSSASVSEEVQTEGAAFDAEDSFDVETTAMDEQDVEEPFVDEVDVVEVSPADDHEADEPEDGERSDRKPGRRRRRRRRRKPTDQTPDGESDEAEGIADVDMDDDREAALSDGTTSAFFETTTEFEEDTKADGEDEEEEEEGKPRRRRRRRRRRRKDSPDAAAEETTSQVVVADRSLGETDSETDDEALQFANVDDSIITIDEPEEATPKSAQERDDDSPRKKPHKNIPTWADALSALIERNLEARSRNPDPSASAAPGRGRPRRGRGRSSKKK